MDPIEEKLTGQIIGAAMTVSTRLKPGLGEKLYERALEHFKDFCSRGR